MEVGCVLSHLPVSLSVAILALRAAPTPSTSSHMSMMVVSVTPKSILVKGDSVILEEYDMNVIFSNE